MMLIHKTLTLATVLLVLAASGWAGETAVTVRARAHDAKFIGSSVGGMHVVVKDAQTGKVLNEGTMEGGTGDTDRLMNQPPARGQDLATPNAAGYTAMLNLSKPTLVEIDLEGPLSAGLSGVRASKTLWVLPDHPITGDGIVFDLHGLLVTATAPAPNAVFKADEPVIIRAHVAMLCGCHVTPEGMWDANDYTVMAHVTTPDGQLAGDVPLGYSGDASTFEGTFVPPGPGTYKVWVTAAQDVAANFGAAVTGFTVSK